jgi:exopolysaccharide production protein ExoZ
MSDAHHLTLEHRTGLTMSMTGEPRDQRSSFLGIQYLRGIAALMVVFHHAILYVTTTRSGVGATGVDIFFVISGFIMAHTCARGPRAGESRGFASGGFLLKRCIRLIPLYWLATAISWRPELLHGVWSLDMVKDLLFVPRFFAPDIPRIWPKLIPGWTINCEMFFYLLFAVAVFFSRNPLRLVLIFLCVLSAAGFLLQPASAPAQLYTWSVFLEFAFGILLYLLHRRWTVHAPIAIRLAVLAAAAGALAYAARNNAYEYSQYRFLLYGVPALFIVWTGLQVSNTRELPLLKLLGDASYSVYLFHATVGIRLAIHLLAVLRIAPTNWFSAAAALAIFMTMSAGIGIAIYWFVERPVLDRLRHWSERQMFKHHALEVRSPP